MDAGGVMPWTAAMPPLSASHFRMYCGALMNCRKRSDAFSALPVVCSGLPRWSASQRGPLLDASDGHGHALSSASNSPKNLTPTPQPYGDRRAGA